MEKWKTSATIYEVNIRQYTKEGTFKAFQEHLLRLRKMNVEILWLMPITPIATEKMKGTMGSPYSASDYTSVNPEFGTLEDFKNLVNEAHKLGFKIIIDWVANHTGWNHIWTKSHPEFYKKNEDGTFKTPSGMDDIIELDYSNSELWNAMISAMNFWVEETDIDGFRCDLASWVEINFWKEARPKVEERKSLFWLGEFDELENPEYGTIFDASYSWRWMHETENYCKNNVPLEVLKNLLQEYSGLGDETQRIWFTSNHDENSWNGTEYEKYGELALPLAVFSTTWNGIPLMYSGQELPNRKRLKFFDKDCIEWGSHCEKEHFYSTLFKLKTENPALHGGDSNVQTYFINTTANDKIFAYLRKNGNNEVLVLLNFSREEVHFRIEDDNLKDVFQDIFIQEERNFSEHKEFCFQVSDYAVFQKQNL